ncbi:hypothetical protein [Microbacterium phyllosphaerae]|uniref:hypothetical protein n=1 Tax=Microbacterium phyllosphaerae TaxID=124798 RepID=UPI000EA15F42|nr:hypothetical protein [Microbacterium phyllosphaerae]
MRSAEPFRETLIGPRWLAVAGAMTLIFLLVVTAIAAPVVIGRADEVGAWTIALLVAGFILILVAGLLGITRRITIAVSDTHIDGRLTPFRVIHLPLTEVDRVEVIKITVAQAGGVGWRLAGTEQFVLWSAGAAVRVTTADGRSRALRTEHPEELSTAILSASRAMRE